MKQWSTQMLQCCLSFHMLDDFVEVASLTSAKAFYLLEKSPLRSAKREAFSAFPSCTQVYANLESQSADLNIFTKHTKFCPSDFPIQLVNPKFPRNLAKISLNIAKVRIQHTFARIRHTFLRIRHSFQRTQRAEKS